MLVDATGGDCLDSYQCRPARAWLNWELQCERERRRQPSGRWNQAWKTRPQNSKVRSRTVAKIPMGDRGGRRGHRRCQTVLIWGQVGACSLDLDTLTACGYISLIKSVKLLFVPLRLFVSAFECVFVCVLVCPRRFSKQPGLFLCEADEWGLGTAWTLPFNTAWSYKLPP